MGETSLGEEEGSCPITDQADGVLGRVAGTAGGSGMERCTESMVQLRLKQSKELQNRVSAGSGAYQPREPLASLSLAFSSEKWDLVGWW